MSLKGVAAFFKALFDFFKTDKPAEIPTTKPVDQPDATPVVTGPVTFTPPEITTSTPEHPNFEELAAKVKFDTEPDKIAQLEDICKKIIKNKEKYFAVQSKTGVPAKLVAAIHHKESSLDFTCMLHNGEPLDRQSTIVPIGVGPFKSWEESAIDALNREGAAKIKHWPLATQLEFAEKYNGIGYRKRGIYSSYVFAFTNLSAEKGGYPKDHVWDPEKEVKRPGVAAILLALDEAERRITGQDPHAEPTKPVELPAVISEQEDRTKTRPWYFFSKKYEGKTEHDSAFNKWVSSFWKIVGLPSYKTIIGTSFAWCGLWTAIIFSETGYEHIVNGAGARNWAKSGQAIEYVTAGIPQGAVMHLNHNGICDTSKSNHVTLANGDCAPQDIIEMKQDTKGVWQPVLKNGKPQFKKGATIDGYGGNQNDTLKVSTYPVTEICAVRWPKYQLVDGKKVLVKLPPPVTKSIGCTSKKSSDSSTR